MNSPIRLPFEFEQSTNDFLLISANEYPYAPHENSKARTNEPVRLTLVPSATQKLPEGFSDVRFDQYPDTNTAQAKAAIKRARTSVAKIVASTSPLAALRLHCGLSQEQLQGLCGTAQSTISKAEAGENINQLTIEQIAFGLKKSVSKVSKAYLMTRKIFLENSV